MAQRKGYERKTWKIRMKSIFLSLYFQAVKEFHVSLYQALVLLLFNEHKELGYKDIQEQTKIRMY